VTDKKVKEKWVKQQVVKMLKDRGAYYFYPVASGYMSSGVPDIVACYRGAFMGIECKAGNNKPSVLQEKNLKQIRDNEGIAVVVNEDNLVAFQDFLKHMEDWK
jgi:Holliday junction resolvase